MTANTRRESRVPNSAFRVPRPGMSLTEVLVALFIMALGTIAILTLFPLGMMQMGQALKDDRTAQAAAQAGERGYMGWYWRTQVVENPNAAATEPFVAALDNPDSGASPGHGLPPIAPGLKVPSYPVFVDPMGFVAPWQGSASFQYWVGNQNVPRRSLTQIINNPGYPTYAQRVCSLMDGFTYDPSGIPTGTSGIERDMRYNWLWVVQRPDNTDRNTANLTVVVFDRRSFLYAPPGAETAFNPIVNGAGVGFTSVSFPAGTQLGVTKGGWIMDATINPTAQVRNANFYRVVSVTDSGTSVDVELQTPLKPDTKPVGMPDLLPAQANQRVFIVLTGVSEVFERPNLTANSF